MGYRKIEGELLKLGYDVGKTTIKEILVVYRDLGHRQGESAVLNNMGESAHFQGDFAAAVR